MISPADKLRSTPFLVLAQKSQPIAQPICEETQPAARSARYAGILVRDGLVMVADTRTNAGLDNISVFRKLHSFAVPGERVMAITSSGNLSLSQSVLSILHEGFTNETTGERETLLNAPTMFQAAQRIGRAIRMVHSSDEDALEAADVKFDLSMLFGGQIRGERPRLFMIYSAGNFIECTTDTPYLQIGEHKYGKPVLDRAITYDIDLYDALKIALISVNSTMRSNLSVGMPTRPPGGAPRHLHGRARLPHRAGRALFPGPAPALVRGATRRPPRDPAAALRQSELISSVMAGLVPAIHVFLAEPRQRRGCPHARRMRGHERCNKF